MGLAYGWTIEYVDSLTWPMIRALMVRIESNPPIDLLVGAWFKSQAPKTKTLSQQASASGLPVTRGKVKRYGDKRR
jgi:hypothetical protein